MYTPETLEPGQPFRTAILEKIREILDFLYRSRPIAGPGIELRETASGTEIRTSAGTTGGGSAAVREESRAENRPFDLFIQGAYIECNPGLIWKNGYCSKCAIGHLALPQSSGYIVLDGTLSASLILLSEEEYSRAGKSDATLTYWQTHAVIGFYNAEKKKLTQLHNAPIIYLLETTDFVVPV